MNVNLLILSLKQILQQNFAPCTVTEADDAESAGLLLVQKSWDVIVLDIDLPDRSGVDFLRDIADRSPHSKVLVFSGCNELEFGLRAVKAGAAGFLPKASTEPDIRTAVQRVMNGQRYISQDLAACLADFTNKHENQPPHHSLSEREFEVLRLFGVGSPASEIAEKLGLSVKTVSTYRTRILQKLGLRTTGDIVRYAVNHKLS